MADIKNIYMTANKIFTHGVEGYHVNNKYFDPNDQIKLQKKSVKKIDRTKIKKTYLDDYIYLHKQVPGPGKYNDTQYRSTFSCSKSKQSKNKKYADKKTIFDQMCQKLIRDKVPAPGQYEPQMKIRPSTAKTRKPQTKDRINYLDEVQYESAATPGVGQYNVRPQSAKVKATRMQPEDWIKKHSEKQKIKKPKQPAPGSYNPIIFGKKDFSKRMKNQSTFGSIDRFKTTSQKAKIGPGKYIKHTEWDKPVQYGCSITTPSVYYR